MRLFAALALVWCCAVNMAGAATNGLPAELEISGHKYVQLGKWAEFRKLHLAQGDAGWVLSNASERVCLRLNSARAEVNGISLFLGFPVVLRENAPWMAQKDAERSLAPLLFPQKNRPGEQARVIAISAGHGGKDTGNILGAHLEKKFTLLLAKELQRRCQRAGLKTVLVRDSDAYLSLAERTQLAMKGKAGVYIDLHYNSAGLSNTVSKGAEVYCLTMDGATSTNGGTERYPGSLAGNQHDEKNVLLAYAIQRALVTHAGMADRGVRRARFEVLRDAGMPAVLIEAGFMSEPGEMRKIQDAGHRRRTAQAILEGLLAYKRAVDL
jgi:N-acetylmuramoyl-L-alanine amidase